MSSFGKFAIAMATSVANAASREHVFFAKPQLHCSWRVLEDEPVADDRSMSLILALKPQSFDDLISAARSISDPTNDAYGKYLSGDEIAELSAPADGSLEIVEDWLRQQGASTRVLNHGAALEAHMSAAAVNAAFRTEVQQHVNDVTGQIAVRAGDYSLPSHVADTVVAVHGLHGLPLPPRGRVGRQRAEERSPVNITPEVIRSTYGVAGVTPTGSTANRQAVAEFQMFEYVNQTDVDDFFRIYVPEASAEQAKVNTWVGDFAQQYGIVPEAILDVEYIMGAAPGILTDFWYWSANDFCLDMMNWSTALLDSENPPLVHSVSYGYQGNLSDIGCSDGSIQSIEANFAKLAVAGISIIFASGDDGSGYTMPCNAEARSLDVQVVGPVVKEEFYGNANSCCQHCKSAAWSWVPPNNCTYYASVEKTVALDGAVSGGVSGPSGMPKALPAWPASSVWVTAVGGTKFQDQILGGPEMAVEEFGSGGGFSPTFAMPDYQNASVADYLASAPQLPPSGSFALGGRATPDVAAFGENFLIRNWGYIGSASGTSAAAPAFAALVSLLNEARLAESLPPLGFLNPLLYQNPDAFTDVVHGTNAIARSGDQLPFGFNCTKGWDPVTGLGTPNFPKLLDAVMAAARRTVASVTV